MFARNLFEELIDFTPSLIWFHITDHIQEKETRSMSFDFLDASRFEHFMYIIKKVIGMTSMRRGSTPEGSES